MTELSLSEEEVLEGLNAVSTAKRVANMVWQHLLYHDLYISLTQRYTQELHDSEFGKREEIHAKKAAKRAKET